MNLILQAIKSLFRKQETSLKALRSMIAELDGRFQSYTAEAEEVHSSIQTTAKTALSTAQAAESNVEFVMANVVGTTDSVTGVKTYTITNHETFIEAIDPPVGAATAKYAALVDYQKRFIPLTMKRYSEFGRKVTTFSLITVEDNCLVQHIYSVGYTAADGVTYEKKTLLELTS